MHLGAENSLAVAFYSLFVGLQLARPDYRPVLFNGRENLIQILVIVVRKPALLLEFKIVELGLARSFLA